MKAKFFVKYWKEEHNIMNIAFDFKGAGFSAWGLLPLSLDNAIVAFDHPLRVYKATSFGGTTGIGYCLSDWFHIPTSIYYNLPYSLDGYRLRITISDAVYVRGYADTTITFYEKDGYGGFDPAESFTKSVWFGGELIGAFDLDFTLHKMSGYEVKQYAMGRNVEVESLTEAALMRTDQELLKAWNKKFKTA